MPAISQGLQPAERVSIRNKYRDLVEEMLASADVKINGGRPHDLEVKDERFFKRLLADGALGWGESYMDGWWECDRLDTMTTQFLQANLAKTTRKNPRFIFYAIKAKFDNPARKSRAFQIGERHYDIPNEVFQIMLDKRMVYSCAYWKNAATLNQAQEDKLELICRKLGLKPGMRFLDIGCGWGGLVKYAAEKFGVEAVGITVSKEQVKHAQEVCAGLPVEIRLQDYRELNEKFDRIASAGMFEHVCHQNHRTYMNVVHKNLADDGLFLLHCLGLNENERTAGDDRWMRKYIFPNSEEPSIQQIAKAFEGLFVMEDWHNFGTYYDATLGAWYQNFIRGWDKIKSRYDERFFKMWRFYLLTTQGMFRARFTQLWQVVLSKNGIPGGYQKNIDYNFQ